MNKIINYIEELYSSHIWSVYAEFLELKLSGKLTWPDWCFCPLNGIITYLSRSLDSQPLYSILEKYDPWAANAAAAWRVTKGVYRFDPDVYNSLTKTNLLKVPTKCLYRLPEYCVYIETPNFYYHLLKENINGFYAYLDYDVKSKEETLRIILNLKNKYFPEIIHLHTKNLEESFNFLVQEIEEKLHKKEININQTETEELLFRKNHIDIVVEDIGKLLNLLLYLCADEADISQKSPPSLKSCIKKTKKHGISLIKSKRANIVEVAFRIGKEIRRYHSKTQGQSIGSEKSPHIRRAHWHSYWVGSGNNKRRILKWLAPIPVKTKLSPHIKIYKIKNN